MKISLVPMCMLFAFLNVLQVSYAQVDVDLNTTFSSTSWSQELVSSSYSRHKGYTLGLDIVISTGGVFFMPGLHFQQISLYPEAMNWKNPYSAYTGIKSFKLPAQFGFYLFRNKIMDIKAHGGISVTYLIDVDKNDQVLEEDLTQLRTGLIAGVTFKLLFFTIHTSYENNRSRLFLKQSPSGIINNSKDKGFSLGVGIYL